MFLVLISLNLVAQEIPKQESFLYKNCLSCHVEQQIPSELIYRRYLMKYSSDKVIKNRLLKYLKNPQKEESIMPKQFFMKFSQKRPMDLNSTQLEEGVDAYLEFFNMKKKLRLPSS